MENLTMNNHSVAFNVLDRNVNVHHNYLLEASAGTGKTFSIEHIVVRLLIETNPENQKRFLLDQILIVTFTRAAVRDLKTRIHNALESAVAALNLIENNSTNIPDYLQAIISLGQKEVDLSKRYLEQALATFDQAQIYTIHSFCMRMLTHFIFESDFHINEKDNNLSKEEALQLIRNFLRTKIQPGTYSAAQVHVILNHHDNCIEKVEEALFKYVNSDYNVKSSSHFSKCLEHFNQMMFKLKNDYHFQSEKLRQDFERQIGCYNKITDEVTESICKFLNLFSQNEWSEEDLDFLILDGLLICEFLGPENINKRKKPPEPASLNYPDLIAILQKTLTPLLNEARSYACIFARMVNECRQLLNTYLEEEEKQSKNDILKNMLNALKNPSFEEKILNLYHIAIVDEFQDTDPMQWEIFKKLFLDKGDRKIYVVGDPKQSIYAFRQADIYTYLNAAQSFSPDHRASLEINYRSQPSLIQGLNILFQACPQMFPLPALPEKSIDCPLARIPTHAKNRSFSDELKSIHFYHAQIKKIKSGANWPTSGDEEEFYFPFIAQEIMRLQRQDQLKFSQFAVLIKDRFQAQRLANFFEHYLIPNTIQKQLPLKESPAWNNLKELLRAILHPRDQSAVKIALGGQIIGWDSNQIKSLNNPPELERILSEFFILKRKLAKEGFAHFFYQFLQSCWHSDELSVMQKMLEREKGDIFFDELNQIASLLIEYQTHHSSSPEHLLEFLIECEYQSPEDEERLNRFTDPTRDAVSILTIYNSKGLEYDIVFAQALLNRYKNKDQFIPQKDGLSQYLIPNLDQNAEAYRKYCEELDAEKMRQLYVAITRAKYRLYLPVASVSDNYSANSLEFGSASPIDLFLARLGKPSCNYEELYKRIEINADSYVQKFIKDYPANFSYTALDEMTFTLSKIKLDKIPELIPPEHVEIPGATSFIQSFTSLTKYKSVRLENGVTNMPHDFNCSEKNCHTLPASNLTGKLLHKILETISISDIQGIGSPPELIHWVRPLVCATPFATWENVICEMIYQALKVNLNKNCCLSEIDPLSLYRETEFLYPCGTEMYIEGLQWNTGFLKGVMDLVFRHNDLYYLVDWKSNWLGASTEDYTKEKMILAMEQSNYFIQAHIYKEALKRYLKLVDKRPFETIYGGCYYIFLRGLDQNQSTGIYEIC